MGKLSVITGGRGYVGFALVKELEERGEKMRLLLRSDSDDFDGIECEKFMGDITDLDQLREAFKGADTVYHIAGLVDITDDRADLLWQVNVEGTKNVVTACKECGVKTLIYCSSVDAIDVARFGDGIITEISKFVPENLEGTYAKTKASATKYVLENAGDDLKVCVVHPSCCIGPYDNNCNSIICSLIRVFANGLFSFSPDFGGYNFVDVRDVAIGMANAVEKGRNGECYLLTGWGYTLAEFFEAICEIAGHNPPKIKVYKKFLQAVLPSLELFFDIFNIPPAINSYSLRKICENYNFSFEKAHRELGYYPRPFMTSLKDTVKWVEEREQEKKDEEKFEKEKEWSRKFHEIFKSSQK